MRQGEVYDFGASSSELSGDDGKNRGKEEERLEGAPDLIGERRAAAEVSLTCHGSADMLKPEVAPAGARRSQWKLADGEVSTCLHCSNHLPNCHSLHFSNYSQIFMVTPKSPKIKVVPNLKFYNFYLITIPKLCLDFEMQV